MDELIPLTLLYVEDEQDLRERVRIILEMHFSRVIIAANGAEGLELFVREHPDVVVSDIQMPVLDGLAMSRRIRAIAPQTPIILCTAFTETTYLLQAIELGISAYVRKPLDCHQLAQTIQTTAAPILHQRELDAAKRRELSSLELLLGESPAMQTVIRQAQQVASTDFSLTILGETGVGKSHLASLIHGLSLRKHHPFIPITIGALPETLVESELFGHVKGAFTGATTIKKGLFEEADHGTLFLDDVDCAPPVVQAKILHAVEQKRFFPVGGVKPIAVDLRVIVASNRNLLLEVQAGRFREDLYYRLNDLMITIPPLRERGGDVILLSQRFLQELSRDLGRTPPRLTADAAVLLQRHTWPGNVRELRSVIKRVTLFTDTTITSEQVAQALTSHTPLQPNIAAGSKPLTLDQIKYQAVQQALIATGGKKMEAARLLDVEYRKFKRMLEKHQF